MFCWTCVFFTVIYGALIFVCSGTGPQKVFLDPTTARWAHGPGTGLASSLKACFSMPNPNFLCGISGRKDWGLTGRQVKNRTCIRSFHFPPVVPISQIFAPVTVYWPKLSDIGFSWLSAGCRRSLRRPQGELRRIWRSICIWLTHHGHAGAVFEGSRSRIRLDLRHSLVYAGLQHVSTSVWFSSIMQTFDDEKEELWFDECFLYCPWSKRACLQKCL